jgi:hypothetical protein
MGARPAAKERPTSTALDAVHQRLYEFLDRMPASSRALLAASLLPAGDGPPVPDAGCRNDFYWLLIPEWLAGEAVDELADILWAQYCLYALFRAQDDAVDDATVPAHLAVAANRLATEASRRLQVHFSSSSPLWDWYHGAIEATSGALIEIDHRQSEAARDGEADLRLYAALSRCLTVATRAVHLLQPTVGDWRRWSRLLDHLAVAGQILDDLHDLQTDLRSGRHNFAAWLLTRPVFARSIEATEAIVASNLATTDRLAELFAHVHRHLAGAAALLTASDDPRVKSYVARFQRTTGRLEARMTSRHQRLFSPPPRQSTQRASAYTAT